MLDLPDYKVRWSSRAKRLSVQTCLLDGLVVTAPKRMNPAQVKKLLLTQKDLLVSMEKRLLQHRASPTYVSRDQLPGEIAFPSINRSWFIEYQETPSMSVRVQPAGDGGLRVTGKVSDKRLCREALHRWLRQMGKCHLEPWLKSVSEDIRLPYHSAVVRRQRTRMGSCSSNKTISLNCKLLFLGPQLVRYLFIHELCHTVHMDHSKNFWALVKKFEPEGKQLGRRLRQEWSELPLWTL